MGLRRTGDSGATPETRSDMHFFASVRPVPSLRRQPCCLHGHPVLKKTTSGQGVHHQRACVSQSEGTGGPYLALLLALGIRTCAKPGVLIA